jgi:hypothetical protein
MCTYLGRKGSSYWRSICSAPRSAGPYLLCRHYGLLGSYLVLVPSVLFQISQQSKPHGPFLVGMIKAPEKSKFEVN